MLVVGGGPAGTAAAHFLARAGRDVLLVDRERFPRDKICGDGLAPRSVAALRRLGVEANLRREGHEPLSRYRITSTWGEPVEAGLPGFGKGPGYTYVVPRRRLDAMLVDAARTAGAAVLEGTRVLRLESSPERPVVLARSDEGEALRISPRVVIAADGSRASFSRTVVDSARVEPYAVAVRAYYRGVEGVDGALGFFLDRRLLPGYGWIFPASRPGDPHNVGVGMFVSSLRSMKARLRDLFDWFVADPESSGSVHLRRAEPVTAPATFPLMLDFARGIRRRGRVLFAGDTANLVDPLSGEGMAYAFESGEFAGSVTAEALETGDLSRLAGYERLVWSRLAHEFGGAWLLREFLVHPWGNGAMIRLMLRDEGIARGGMGVLSNSVPAPWLLRPVVWRRVLRPARLRRVLRPKAGSSATRRR